LFLFLTVLERVIDKHTKHTEKERLGCSFSLFFYHFCFVVVAGLYRLLYYNGDGGKKAFGTAGNVSNWSLGRMAWKKRGGQPHSAGGASRERES
jgi:hypothetical protein